MRQLTPEQVEADFPGVRVRRGVSRDYLWFARYNDHPGEDWLWGMSLRELHDALLRDKWVREASPEQIARWAAR